MPAYNANNVNLDTNQNSNNVSDVTTALFKEQRARLQMDRRQSWLADVVKKHTVK